MIRFLMMIKYRTIFSPLTSLTNNKLTESLTVSKIMEMEMIVKMLVVAIMNLVQAM